MMNLSIWIGVMDDWYGTTLSMAMCVSSIIESGGSGSSPSLISRIALLGSIRCIAIVIIVVSWNGRLSVLVGRPAVSFWGSSRGTSHACVVGRTNIAEALVLLVVLLFHNGRAASAHGTKLGVVVGLLVALPERRLLASARCITVRRARTELLLFLMVPHQENGHDGGEKEEETKGPY